MKIIICKILLLVLRPLENKQMTSVNDAKGAREPWIRDVTLLSLCWQNSFYA